MTHDTPFTNLLKIGIKFSWGHHYASVTPGDVNPFELTCFRRNCMSASEIMKGKRILVVDDEPDILEVIKEQLPDCRVETAGNFDLALNLVMNGQFDLVILDIMGVSGFSLLEECRKRNLPAAMLTAHAINIDSLNRSIRLGAVSFIPKDELARLPIFIDEIFENIAEPQGHWPSLFSRTGPFFRERLGIVWENLEKPPTPPKM